MPSFGEQMATMLNKAHTISSKSAPPGAICEPHVCPALSRDDSTKPVGAAHHRRLTPKKKKKLLERAMLGCRMTTQMIAMGNSAMASATGVAASAIRATITLGTQGLKAEQLGI